MQTHPPLRRSGFTLLELMLVIVMLGLVSLVSFRRVGAMTTQWRVNRAAQAYGEELQAAFAIVGRDRRPVSISLRKDSMQVRITNRDSSVVYRKRDIGRWSAYKLDSANVQPSKLNLEVYPPGLAADSLQIEITREGKYRRVRMLRGGLVQICSNHPSPNGVCVPA
jgi:prepilin-type N-terminal cleavage/methylation domain-containing protein